MKTNRRGRVTLLAVTAALTAAVVAPGVANAAVGLTITGDVGCPSPVDAVIVNCRLRALAPVVQRLFVNVVRTTV